LFKNLLTEFRTFSEISYRTKWEWSVVLQTFHKAPERQVTNEDFLVFDEPATPLLHEWLSQFRPEATRKVAEDCGLSFY